MLSRTPCRALRRSSCRALVLGTSGVLLFAAPAAAGSHRVSGSQIAVDEANGVFKMTGSLVGDWNVTKFDQSAATPLVRATGTELFKGCLDLHGDAAARATRRVRCPSRSATR